MGKNPDAMRQTYNHATPSRDAYGVSPHGSMSKRQYAQALSKLSATHTSLIQGKGSAQQRKLNKSL